MTNITTGSDTMFFDSKDAIVGHLLHKVLANKNRMIGTEWEIFFLDEHGKAISRENGQKAFKEYKRIFALHGYTSTLVYERSSNGQIIFGLNVDGLGLITPEMGHQFEFACSVSKHIGEIREKNEKFYNATCDVAKCLRHTPVFKGHVSGYVDSTEGSYRSRSNQWREYFDKRFGANAISVREALDATASTQITLDSGAEDFHEFVQALLLIEPALTLYFANSIRPYVGVHRLPSSHIKPIIGVWGSKTPKEALNAIVDRLMEVDIPFLPDPQNPDIYKAEPFIGDHPPTIQDLMNLGRLNEKVLNNAGGFLLARPALRRFSPALLEMRGVDSQPTPDMVAEVARRAIALVYDDAVRKALLSRYAHLNKSDIQALHDASAMENRSQALNITVAGMRMDSFVNDIVARSDPMSQKVAVAY